MNAGDDFGEGRFTRAVLAQKRMDLPRHKIEIDIAQHFNAGELF